MISSRIKLRADTLTNWSSSDIVLLENELCLVYCENDVIRFKVGDGESTFAQLKYTDETQIITQLLTVNNINQGVSNVVSNDSIVAGVRSNATGSFSEAHGLQSAANHNFSFVWSGTSQDSLADRYESNGIGTFSINPEGGLSGFYIGDTNLYDLLSNKVDKVAGKGLSTNDFTNEEKIKLASALTEHQDISGKVDKVEGKGLSTLDVTQAMLDAKVNVSDLPVFPDFEFTEIVLQEDD